MFTINPYLKFALIAVGIIGGVLLSVTQGFWYGFPFWLAGIILLIGYLMLGTIGSASKMLQAQDFEKAERLLSLTFFPGLLYVTYRAYYYMLKGSIAMQKKDMDGAEENLKMAESLEMPTDNDKAMVYIQLANIAATRNKWRQAEIYMKNLKGMKISEPSIKEQRKMLEKALKNKGQMKAAARMGNRGMMQAGGKRRRPKMR